MYVVTGPRFHLVLPHNTQHKLSNRANGVSMTNQGVTNRLIAKQTASETERPCRPLSPHSLTPKNAQTLSDKNAKL